MEVTKFISPDGREICVYDNVLGPSNRQTLLFFLSNSFFKPVGIDTPDENFKHHTSMMSCYSMEDVKKSKFLDYLPEEIKKEYSDHINIEGLENCNLNLVTPSDRFHVHTDSSAGAKITVMYYPTSNWDVEFGGDSIFLDSKGKDIEFYCQYKTDRLVIFDSNIPHVARPSTWLAPYYRLSLAMKFL